MNIEAGENRGPGIPALLTDSTSSQRYREHLEKIGIFDGRYRAQKLSDCTVAIPVLKEKLSSCILEELTTVVAPGSSCRETLIMNPVLSKRARIQSPAQKLRIDLCELLESHGVAWPRDLERDLPHSWQKHGDLIVFNENCFNDPLWKQQGPELWINVASSLGVRRLAKEGCIQDDGVRSPTVTLLLGDSGWVEHIDNGIRYTFDVTKCMFSAGNISEKQRVASFCCSGEIVVDLYAGIGYFTVPYLVHAGASFVHACEWNPHAVKALKQNLELNRVSEKCLIHEGDNRQLKLQDVADRVNLGLIPTSEPAYEVACRVLKKDTGGILHIHHNVNSFIRHAGLNMNGTKEDVIKWKNMAWKEWAEGTESQVRAILMKASGSPWHTQILHLEKVKSYAPYIDHVVLDLDCRPLHET
ncbi:tRNA wybutosine-synthesizing 2 homolog [Pelobates cultripes]|uniref:tRNA wybutosine-synthesizing protein 2 homolog n=2 Tax=Pelobates cultripes TaxID=61616 RepID=A0AAD1T2R0_PELCU|nr:tRNA wybutosine-synthesizing 2 homolog [Pelobates cultripes]